MADRSCEGILLYYKYVDLVSNQEDVSQWFLSLCERLELKGRIRVARDGINCTIGGSLASLRIHIKAVRCHELFGDDIDFKLAASSGAASDQAAAETGFKSLSVSICEEVVAMGSTNSCSPAQRCQAAAPHASPQQFHSIIAGAEDCPEKETVLLDVRNCYEARIGRFQKEGVKLLNPHLRCFGDLTSWLDQHAAELAGRKVLMYCTGGVRCERASAYLRSKGSAFQDVVQLQGGIQRYMEAFSHGGFFMGRNFVFDERVTVASEGGKIVGRCLTCSAPHDTYEPRRRCQHCRMLVLVCPTCAAKGTNAALLCELCLEKGLRAEHVSSASAQANSALSCRQASAVWVEGGLPSAIESSSSASQQRGHSELPLSSLQAALQDNPCTSALYGNTVRHMPQDAVAGQTSMVEQEQSQGEKVRRLRILCLHGFRQSASSLRGRTAALARKLADLAELNYVDAPHPLPFLLKQPSLREASGCDECAYQALQNGHTATDQQESMQESARPQHSYDPCKHSLRKDGSSSSRRLEASNGAPSRREAQEGLDIAAELDKASRKSHIQGGIRTEQSVGETPPRHVAALPGSQSQLQQKRFRRAWLLEPKQVPMSEALAEDDLTDTQPSFVPTMDVDQHTRQTEGWQSSWEHLKTALDAGGPFDGIMGFSQGAAIAAAVCAIQQSETSREAHAQQHCSRDIPLHFAICCSGYPSAVQEHQELQKSIGSIRLPSLHVYGAKGEDRQVAAQESRALSEQFDITQRYVIEHSCGHVIPSSKAVVNRMRDFLKSRAVLAAATDCAHPVEGRQHDLTISEA